MHTISAEPVARIPHTSEVCRQTIEPGERYDRGTTFDGGDVFTWRAHLTPCTEATDRARASIYGEEAIAGDDVRAWAADAAETDPVAAEVLQRLGASHTSP
ncbi:hypothetical protein ACXR2T_07965 [Leucobacter sp. HY1910]